ncbi:MAG: hypothetical protein JNL73_16055 [Anaerolineales bacterium]|nr:hypothetical protein [Anaerolineales bacterium]
MSRKKPRILLYSHDTFGLGHLRRTLAIGHQLAQDLPTAHQLLVTGSMVAGAFALPRQLDLLKLPALSKRSSGKYVARALPLKLSDTLRWRERLLLDALTSFAPDVVLVDKAPAGVQGELLPLLRHVKTWMPKTRLVLGMRDIEDDPATTAREWSEWDIPRLQAEVYDHILYYGDPTVFNPADAYDMSAAARARLVACGYLGRSLNEVDRPTEHVRRELGLTDQPLVVVTAGGGGDGFALLRAITDAVVGWPGGAPFHALVVTGPLMAANKRQVLRQAQAASDRLTVLEFTPRLFTYMAAADLIIGMAGYNTVVEALSLGKRTLYVPRTRPRQEQLIRAERLADRGWARLILPEALSADTLAAQITLALSGPAPHITASLDGLTTVGATIAGLFDLQPQSALALGRPA